MTPGATIVGVYRRRNAERVLSLIGPALECGWGTAWWALDGVHSKLDEFTVGEGPGAKFPLVNETMRRVTSGEWIVVSDDDLRFCRGDVVEFVKRCHHAGLDLAQPARERMTASSHEITVSRRFTRARLTTFVECGPLFAIGPRVRSRVLPLRAELEMGWGAELDWFDLAMMGYRLGIVDSMTVEHLGKVADEYSASRYHDRLRAALAERGAVDLLPFQRTISVWRPWQFRPGWLRS